MTVAEQRALETTCPACGAQRGRCCLHLSLPRPKPWLSDRDWLAAWRALELVRLHRQRAERFRDLVLHHEHDHRDRPYRLTQASRLRVGQLILVEKDQVDIGTIIVPRKARRVRHTQDRRVFVLFRGRIWHHSAVFADYLTVRTLPEEPELRAPAA